ncbi:RICIN domain-containing protein [Streptomyces sp. NPDC058424]|uniref:RICIN domain-containing protein n=1 Tax=Streptomyces sp. NPDC058424 TaxID=3346491 RepID=UPI00365A05E3
MGTGPDPKAARTPAEFVATMRQLRTWADLSYRQLERRATDAGDALPRATISGVLAREDLPREELLAAFVRACGGDPATVEAWLDARRRLAMRMEPAAPEGASETAGATPASKLSEHDEPGTIAETDSANGMPQSTFSGGTIDDTSTGTDLSTSAESPEGVAPAPAPQHQLATPPQADDRKPPTRYLSMALIGACAAVGVLAVALWPDAKPVTTQPRADSRTTASPPASGWWRIHPSGGPYQCLQSDEIMIFSGKCPGSSPAEAYLESLGGSIYRIQFREGDSRTCWGALRSSIKEGMGVVREPCTDRAQDAPPNQKFRLERTDSGHYRLRLLHSGLCVRVIDNGEVSSLRQTKCNGLALQEFALSKT